MTNQRRRPIIVVILAFALIGGAATVYLLRPDPTHISEPSADGPFDYDYVIPAGTQDRIDQGDEVEVVPQTLTVRVGESIRIVNDDDTDHLVGAFFIPAGTTLRQHFVSPGELVGECDVHPSGSFTLLVEP